MLFHLSNILYMYISRYQNVIVLQIQLRICKNVLKIIAFSTFLDFNERISLTIACDITIQ